MKVKDRAARRRKDTLPALCLPGQGQRRGGGGGQRRGCGSPGRAASQATAIHPRLGGESAGQRAHRSASKGGAISSAAEYGKPVRRCTYLRTAVGIGSRQQRRRHGSLGGTTELERPVASIAQVASGLARAMQRYGYQPVPAKEFLGFLSFPPKGTPSQMAKGTIIPCLQKEFPGRRRSSCISFL